MAAERLSCFRDRMDEPIIDCHFCGAPPLLEFRQEYLNDEADWCRSETRLICSECVKRVNVVLWSCLPDGQRLVVQRC